MPRQRALTETPHARPTTVRTATANRQAYTQASPVPGIDSRMGGRRTGGCGLVVGAGCKRLLDTLKETGEYDNTIIIYTSDQGMMLGEHDLINKRWMFEESIRILCQRLFLEDLRNWPDDDIDFSGKVLSVTYCCC